MIARKRLVLLFLALLLALAAVPPAASSLSARSPAAPGAQAAGARPQVSQRLIVELKSAPVAVWARESAQVASAEGGSPLASPAAQAYAAQLQQEQSAFVQAMARAVPSATVSQFVNETGAREAASYRLVFNGMSVDPGAANRDEARRQLLALPNVKAVYLDFPHHTTLYTSTALINAPLLWNSSAIGGRPNAGAGVKVASMDGGVHKDAPMFSGEGYSYPPNFPQRGLGLTANNNGKIIASRAYFRAWDPPAPGDENPWPGENGTSHGVHTAGIAAGNVVTATYGNLTFPNMSGVAPRAWLMSYRVFYASVNGNESFYTTEGIAALEDIVADGADVLNGSWGEGPTAAGGEFDPLDTALLNADQAGVFISLSAGNSGPGGGTVDHPSADYINVAASTTSGTLASGRLNVTAPAPVPDELRGIEFATASFGASLPFAEVRTYPFLPARSVDPTNENGCNSWPAGTFAGKAALISRGVCEFGVKVLNAEQAGASFVVVYNHAAGGDELISMGPGVVGDQVTIPSIFVGNTSGEALVDWYGQHGGASVLELNTEAFQAGNTPDRLANFSSRGPGVGNTLKPDIVAPGVNILSQGYTPGATGEERHLGFGQVSGTSMAAPHVAGAAALLRQIHPTWSNAYIKSALMSTAKYLDIYNADETPAQPLDMGAGRLDLTRAADPGVILDPPNLGFGLVPTDTTRSLVVTLTSVTTQTETYNVSTLYTGGGFTATTTLPGFTVTPATVTVPAGGQATLTVSFDPAASQGLGENQGYIVLDGPAHDAHMPAWARVTYAAQQADVLILDNDLSSLDPAFGLPKTADYRGYYTAALDQLGLSYKVWDVDAHAADPSALPDLATLLSYDTILLFTGDNSAQVLSATDQDKLVEVVNNGRTLIAMGQDLAAALGAASPEAGIFLYNNVLGANWLDDSVTDDEQPALPVIAASGAPGTFRDIRLDLGETGDGAGNQTSVDEFQAHPPLTDVGDPSMPEELEPFVPLLRYPGPDTVEEGVVAVGHRDQPSLEVPGVAYYGRSIYAGFGLEGVNNTAGTTSRADLLKSFMTWAGIGSTAAVSITYTTVPTSNLTIFEANFTSPISGTEGVSYRWDFGDESGYTNAFPTTQSSHTYEECGTYVVRVEVTDSYGNRMIGTQQVNVNACVDHRLHLPLVGRP